MTNLVTYVLPLYHPIEEYLLECIDSIIGQNSSHWSAIVIQDGALSCETTIDRLKSDKRFTIIVQKENKGLYATLNNVVKLVSTAYLSFIFQDDLLLPEHLAQFECIQKPNTSIDIFWARNLSIEERDSPIDYRSMHADLGVYSGSIDSWRFVLERGGIWIISGSFVRTSLLSSKPFDPSLPHCGDFQWFSEISREHLRAYSPLPLSIIRAHPDQRTYTHAKNLIDIKEFTYVRTSQIRKNIDDCSLSFITLLFKKDLYMSLRRLVRLLINGNLVTALRALIVCMGICFSYLSLGLNKLVKSLLSRNFQNNAI